MLFRSRMSRTALQTIAVTPSAILKLICSVYAPLLITSSTWENNVLRSAACGRRGLSCNGVLATAAALETRAELGRELTGVLRALEAPMAFPLELRECTSGRTWLGNDT